MEDLLDQIPLNTDQVDKINEVVSDRAKTCKAATLTAWIAFLTCLIVVTHAVIALLDSLFANEKFWQQADQILSALHQCEQSAAAAAAVVADSGGSDSR